MSQQTEHERTPDEIRRDIEQTREQVAETAAALAEKADVKSRAHDKVEETKARVKEKVTGTAETAKEKVAGATPESVSTGAQHAAGTARERAQDNPIPVAVVAGVAAGFLLGLLVASRRRRRL